MVVIFVQIKSNDLLCYVCDIFVTCAVSVSFTSLWAELSRQIQNSRQLHLLSKKKALYPNINPFQWPFVLFCWSTKKH